MKEETSYWDLSKSLWKEFKSEGMNKINPFRYLQDNKWRAKHDKVTILEHKIHFSKIGDSKIITIPRMVWFQLHTEDAWAKLSNNEETLIEYYIFYYDNEILHRNNIGFERYFDSEFHDAYKIFLKDIPQNKNKVKI